ncbi:hypothetical protein JKP88DRAFT_293872 [Tribonema minus]|uniref:Uncharacterized protein n=1 Tax=Tribonema minus TaxID=303371 RepID=A0A835ZHB4_9STRA|nr:hypothetical protein JKP88DRAFT_293872 [Tribonema minus]
MRKQAATVTIQMREGRTVKEAATAVFRMASPPHFRAVLVGKPLTGTMQSVGTCQLYIQLKKPAHAHILEERVTDALRGVAQNIANSWNYGNIEWPEEPLVTEGELVRPGRVPVAARNPEVLQDMLRASDGGDVVSGMADWSGDELRGVVERMYTDNERMQGELETAAAKMESNKVDAEFNDLWLQYAPDNRNLNDRAEWRGKLLQDYLYTSFPEIFWEEVVAGKSFKAALNSVKMLPQQAFMERFMD